MTQPGPAATTAIHQRLLLSLVLFGMKRRESTCSPICEISDSAMPDAAEALACCQRARDRADLERLAAELCETAAR